MSTLILQAFINAYPPVLSTLSPVSPDTLAKYKHRLPAGLIELWEKYGFGAYGDGLIQLIHPDEWSEVLVRWIVWDEYEPSRIPIALGSFGHLFYFRNLSEDADIDFEDSDYRYHDDENHDISCINPNYREIQVCTWDSDAFFNDYLTTDAVKNEDLLAPFHLECVQKHGALKANEQYICNPIPILGGGYQLELMTRGDSIIQQHIAIDFVTA